MDEIKEVAKQLNRAAIETAAGKLEMIASDLIPIVKLFGKGLGEKREYFLQQRPYELSSSPDYTELPNG